MLWGSETVRNRDRSVVINELNPVIINLNQLNQQGPLEIVRITALSPRLPTFAKLELLVVLLILNVTTYLESTPG